MREHDICAIPIGENDRLVGMVTDRDIVCRCVAAGLDSAPTISRRKRWKDTPSTVPSDLTAASSGRSPFRITFDTGQVSAQFEDGVFIVTLPKPADAVAQKQSTKIEVKMSGRDATIGASSPGQ